MIKIADYTNTNFLLAIELILNEYKSQPSIRIEISQIAWQREFAK